MRSEVTDRSVKGQDFHNTPAQPSIEPEAARSSQAVASGTRMENRMAAPEAK